MAPAFLPLTPHVAVVANEIARAQQEVDEVETSGTRLGALVLRDQRPEIFAQERCELGTGLPHELLELLLCRRPALLAGGALRVAIAPVPGPSPVPFTRQGAQLGFQAVM